MTMKTTRTVLQPPTLIRKRTLNLLDFREISFKADREAIHRELSAAGTAKRDTSNGCTHTNFKFQLREYSFVLHVGMRKVH